MIKEAFVREVIIRAVAAAKVMLRALQSSAIVDFEGIILKLTIQDWQGEILEVARLGSDEVGDLPRHRRAEIQINVRDKLSSRNWEIVASCWGGPEYQCDIISCLVLDMIRLMLNPNLNNPEVMENSDN